MSGFILAIQSYFKSNEKIAPAEMVVVKTCSLCVEPGAMKRKCCNALYCDHCYTKNQKCPNCDILTKKEALTGATYVMKVFSEHEECRICLDPGLKRRCCNNYYCDECYYKVPTCRSCNMPVGHASENKHNIFMTDRAELFSVFLGWMITVFFVVVTCAFLAVVITAEVQTPVGLFDYKCYGFFRKCGFHGASNDLLTCSVCLFSIYTSFLNVYNSLFYSLFFPQCALTWIKVSQTAFHRSPPSQTGASAPSAVWPSWSPLPAYTTTSCTRRATS